MKESVEMFTVKCDNCGKLFEDEYNGYSCWGDFNDAWENASESNWISEDWDTHYCPNCYTIDEEDNLILKEVKGKTNLPPSEDKEKEPKVFIDISPAKDKKVCSNCANFSRFGVVSGLCLASKTKHGTQVVDENNTCESFKVNE